MAVTTYNKQLQGIILAAGASSRLKTGRTKLIEKICGREMILYPTDTLLKLTIPVTMVVGFQRDVVQDVIVREFDNHVTFIEQKEQKGTGHAIYCTQKAWAAEHILIMNGDMPLVTTDLIEKLYKKHIETQATLTFATAHHCDPEGMYGRVIQANETIQIIEAKDFEGDVTETCCINAGIYIIKKEFLEKSIHALTNNNKAQEWYITDLVKIAASTQEKVTTVSVPFDKIRGVNTFKELWAVEQIKKSEIIQYWMGNGVRFCIAHNVHIDWNVSIGAGTVIGSGVQLFGNTRIGNDCKINSYSILTNAIIKDRAFVKDHTIIEHSTIESEASVGPFAYVHGNSTLDKKSYVGSFVEVNRSEIGTESKAKHLAYLGDTFIHNNVVVGAGTIVCNYDGTHKHSTTIQEGVLVGGNATIIAPVTVGKNSIIAAGSTITDDVPTEGLAIGRARQHNKEEYAPKIRNKQKKSSSEEKFFVGATSKTSFDELQ